MLHLFHVSMSQGFCDEVLHIDDPTYTQNELISIISWEEELQKNNHKGTIITTNIYTKDWLVRNSIKSKILIVEQGYSSLPETTKLVKNAYFSCAYSSPYIHYGSDKHGKHSAWSANHLLDEIIPAIHERDKNIQIHLIGEVGPNARRKLLSLKNIISHGRVSFAKNQEILRECHVALYPRLYDHKRSVQKISEYLGAELPIISYDLVDTSLVKELEIGICVQTLDAFAEAVFNLSRDKLRYDYFVEKERREKNYFSWKSLARKMEESLELV
jgi:glycosyltransferase involved in cell wall biosynthesis